jgi:trimethylamine--corrinoid protein Co-methyltransferase
MVNRTVLLPRPRLLAEEQLEGIHEAAIRILTEQGLLVRDEGALEACARAGLRVQEGRVFPDRRAFEEFMAETRARPSQEEAPAEAPRPDILLSVCQYATHVHDLDTDTIVPFTAERVVEAAKFMDAMSSRGLIGKPPGVPMDVAPDLQPVLQYKISAEHCRHGRNPAEVRSPRAMPYMMEMAEALGSPLRTQPVYVVTPLTIGSDSLACALAGRDRLESLWVSDMLSVGGSAPIRIPDALALALAEVVGGGIAAREATGLPVQWSVRACAFDLRSMALAMGSPEEILFQWASEEANAFYHGWELGPPGGSLHTQAKLPGPQAAAERMHQLMLGALLGTRVFTGAGRLSLDEVFSAEQVVIDCEMRDHVQRLVAGMDGDCDPEACAAEVRAGMEQGFVGLESTAALYREVYWLPQLFERRSLAGWMTADSPDLRRRAQDIVREQMRQHDYELDPDLHRAVDRIYARAHRELSG